MAAYNLTAISYQHLLLFISSEYIYIRNRNAVSEGVRMCHGTVGVIITNTLNMRTPVCTVACKQITCIYRRGIVILTCYCQAV